jgi:protein-S-isoprenylcysteine O-methyltransferase Ste14
MSCSLISCKTQIGADRIDRTLQAVFLGIGVWVFIRAEERQLGQVFGHEYAVYLAKVDRLVPFKKP